MIRSPFSFARKIDEALMNLDRVPLFGNAPRIDLEQLSTALSSRLDLPSFSFSMEGASWIPASEIRKNLGEEPFNLGISASPLEGEALFLMSHQDASRLTSWFLQQKNGVRSEQLEEGFLWYFALKLLGQIQDEPPFKKFTLRLQEEVEDPTGYLYSIDLKCSSEGRSCFGRLILPSRLLTSWQNYFSSLPASDSFPPLAKSLELPVGVHIGSVLLSQKEWREAQRGDVLLLDRGSYDPRHKEGIASLCIGSTPLFHISVKQDRLKLLEPAFFYEEDMDKREAMSESNEVPSEDGPNLAVKELPLFITVELARLRMTVDQLMKLTPGNFLELPVHPEQGVTLTVNGQRIGRGEIVYLGETLGIRLLELA